MLITTVELEKILNNSDLLLIDTRSYKEYSEGHIPGAVNLDLFGFHWIDTSKATLPLLQAYLKHHRKRQLFFR
jgi:thiosulfate/3-mercaptopyruvate sulfurtransferase